MNPDHFILNNKEWLLKWFDHVEFKSPGYNGTAPGMQTFNSTWNTSIPQSEIEQRCRYHILLAAIFGDRMPNNPEAWSDVGEGLRPSHPYMDGFKALVGQLPTEYDQVGFTATEYMRVGSNDHRNEMTITSTLKLRIIDAQQPEQRLAHRLPHPYSEHRATNVIQAMDWDINSG